jgi:Xaa-Pro aminopeptidase
VSVKHRLNKFMAMAQSKNIDAFLITAEPNVTYLTGYKGTESFALIIGGNKYFLTDFRYAEQAQKEAIGFTVCIRKNRSYVNMVDDLCQKHGVARLGFEPHRMSHSFYRDLSRAMTKAILIPWVNAVESLRIVKEANELKHLRASVRHAYFGMQDLAATILPGMTEREIQARLEYQTKLAGSQKPAFDIIIAADVNASMPHAISGSNKLKKDNILLVDMGCVDDGYHCDLTRCFFTGKIPPLQRKVYDIVRKAQELGIKKVRPGVRASEVDSACRDYIDKKGYAKYFGHGTGHGVGLEIHEAPNISFRSKEVLEEGMIVTVEPGIYLPGKFGVRIEDMLMVGGKANHEVLTQSIPKVNLN